MALSPDPSRFADLLVGYCLDVEAHQHVLVRAPTAAAPLVLEIQRAVLERDAWPILRIELPGQLAGFYEHARDGHYEDASPLAYDEIKRVGCLLGIQAPASADELAGVDPQRIARYARGQRLIRERTMTKRWCSTLWPTPAGAERAGMPMAEFEAFVARALFLTVEDPVAAWRGLRAFQADLIGRLRGAREIRIEAEGTDLSLRVDKRTWVNSDGTRNMPSGEVFTGPLEDSASGQIRFDIPSGPPGIDVRGVELTFRDGEVLTATAEEGEDYLRAALATDEGACRVGELGIGTNFGIDRSIGAILFDEKIGGTVHVALGRSYPETGGKNTSALHWDLICDLRPGGRITADGAVLQEDGRFVSR